MQTEKGAHHPQWQAVLRDPSGDAVRDTKGVATRSPRSVAAGAIDMDGSVGRPRPGQAAREEGMQDSRCLRMVGDIFPWVEGGARKGERTDKLSGVTEAIGSTQAGRREAEAQTTLMKLIKQQPARSDGKSQNGAGSVQPYAAPGSSAQRAHVNIFCLVSVPSGLLSALVAGCCLRSSCAGTAAPETGTAAGVSSTSAAAAAAP